MTEQLDPTPVTEHGAPEPIDAPSHPAVTAIGIVLLLILFALGSAGLGRSLGTSSAEDVSVVVIPRGMGRPAVEVQKQLERLGLFVEIRYASNELAPPDTVTAQSPIAGSRTEVGKLVILTVSDGPSGVRIPDASGLRPIAAANLMQVVGLTTTIEEVFDDEVRVGEVVATDPESGSRAALGSGVILKISKGPQPRVVPEIIGLNHAQAFALIAAGELEIGKVKMKVTTDSPDGTVLEATPAPGSEVPLRTPINLVVAEAPARLTTPDLTLMTRTSARSLATNMGIKVEFESVSVPAGDNRGGLILSQTPIAGTAIDKGATINVTIGVAPTPPPTSTTTTTVAGGGD